MKIPEAIRHCMATNDAAMAVSIVDQLRFQHGMRHDVIMRIVEKAGVDPRDFDALVYEGEDIR